MTANCLNNFENYFKCFNSANFKMQNLNYMYFDFGLKITIALASCIKNFHFNHLVYQF